MNALVSTTIVDPAGHQYVHAHSNDQEEIGGIITFIRLIRNQNANIDILEEHEISVYGEAEESL